MKWFIPAAVSIVLLISGLLPRSAMAAGPYADDLAKCMVSSTSQADKNLLVEWAFSAFSADPALASISSVTYSRRQVISKKMAEMVQHIILGPCRKQAKEAVKFEGPTAFIYGFQVLGQASFMEMASDPAVRKAMTSFQSFLDRKAISKALGLPSSGNSQ